MQPTYSMFGLDCYSFRVGNTERFTIQVHMLYDV